MDSALLHALPNFSRFGVSALTTVQRESRFCRVPRFRSSWLHTHSIPLMLPLLRFEACLEKTPGTFHHVWSDVCYGLRPFANPSQLRFPFALSLVSGLWLMAYLRLWRVKQGSTVSEHRCRCYRRAAGVFAWCCRVRQLVFVSCVAVLQARAYCTGSFKRVRRKSKCSAVA